MRVSSERQGERKKTKKGSMVVKGREVKCWNEQSDLSPQIFQIFSDGNGIWTFVIGRGNL